MFIKIYKQSEGGKKEYFHGKAGEGNFEVTDIKQMNSLLFVLSKKASKEGKTVDWEMAS